jgi:hypothetical protein
MSARSVQRALERLVSSNGVLAPARDGASYCVHPGGDRRRIGLVRMSADEVRALEAEGAIVAANGGGFVVSDAGRARLRRARAAPGEAFVAQHRAITDRVVMDGDGRTKMTRGHDANEVLRRLAALRDSDGKPWLAADELAAASRVREDWERSELGLMRGSDWAAPPNASTARGASSAQEAAMAARCDARRRVGEALDRLAPPLRRVVERVCLREQGLEALERSEGWPARSGKLALKLALSQLAEAVS